MCLQCGHMLLVAPRTWWPICGQRRQRWDHDDVMTTHRTDNMYRERFTRAACFAWRRQSNFLEQSVLPGAGRKSCRPQILLFSFSCLCVPQSFRAASFIYNLFVLAVCLSALLPQTFLPSAHAFLTSISDSLAKLLCTAHSCLSRSFSFFMQNKQHLLQQLCIINALASLHSRTGACVWWLGAVGVWDHSNACFCLCYVYYVGDSHEKFWSLFNDHFFIKII